MKLLALFLFSTLIFAESVSEQSLLKMATDTPGLDEIEARLARGEGTYTKAKDALAPEAYVNYNHESTRERAIISFNPIFSPINLYQVGVKKNTKYGISADANMAVQQQSGANTSSTFNDVHTVVYSFGLSFDLWKDLFGKLSRRNLENAKLSRDQARFQSEIEKHNYKLAIRKSYWALVANQEKLKITEKLLKASKKQAKDARQRRANSIADVGEVARYESQVATRKGQILRLNFEREGISKQLRDLIPNLTFSKLDLAPYQLATTVNEVLKCSMVINSHEKAPYDFTSYDEISNLLTKIRDNQKVIDETYDDIDLALSTTVKQTGVSSESNADGSLYDGSYQEALDDIEDNNREGFEAALTLTVPLGSAKSKSQKFEESYNHKRISAEVRKLNTMLETTHIQVSNSVKLLTDAVLVQKQTSEKLGIRVKDMQKKFSQARVSVNDLIQDQDALLSSDLLVVDTQLSVLNTVLDYFSVFNQTPCEFNRI